MTRKILNITDVVSLSSLTLFFSTVSSCFSLNSLSSFCLRFTMKVAACRDTGYDWFEQLLQNVRSRSPVGKVHLHKWVLCCFGFFLTSLNAMFSPASEVWRRCIIQTSQKSLRSASGQSSWAHPQIRRVSCRYASSTCYVMTLIHCFFFFVYFGLQFEQFFHTTNKSKHNSRRMRFYRNYGLCAAHLSIKTPANCICALSKF